MHRSRLRRFCRITPVVSLETRMNCESLFVGARGVTIEAIASDTEIVQRSWKREPSAEIAAVKPFKASQRLTLRNLFTWTCDSDIYDSKTWPLRSKSRKAAAKA